MFDHLYELLQHRAEACPSAIALGGQQRLAWKTIVGRELLDLVDQLADDLASEGIREGDRVVTWVPNEWRTPVYLFALWKLGAVVVPFDREMNPEAAARILGMVEPHCLLTGYGGRPPWVGEERRLEWWEPKRREAEAAVAAAWVRPAETLAAVVFTSGTTGVPKGCMITHTNFCSQVDALQYTIPLDRSCRLASILPLSHLFELTVGLLYPLASGAAIHYIPNRRPTEILRVFREQRITHMMAVPQLLTIMGQTLDEQLKARLPARTYRVLTRIAERRPLESRRRQIGRASCRERV